MTKPDHGGESDRAAEFGGKGRGEQSNLGVGMYVDEGADVIGIEDPDQFRIDGQGLKEFLSGRKVSIHRQSEHGFLFSQGVFEEFGRPRLPVNWRTGLAAEKGGGLGSKPVLMHFRDRLRSGPEIAILLFESSLVLLAPGRQEKGG